MKNLIVVTGGAGFIGSNLINLLLKKTKYKIWSIDNYSTGKKINHILNKRVKYVIEDTKNINKVLNRKKNYIKAIFHFAICIALQHKNEIISGLIFDPIKDEMFFAEKDKGAFLNNQRLRVSKKNSIDECLFSSNHEGVKFSNLNMRYGGCAALDLAYVASGRLDGFFHNNINLWDVAAGEILVKEAGGVVNDIHKFDVDKIDIRAASASINDKMLENLINF
ncbi:NAD-dependent epimerase/dehydratase family protein [bacterium]|nr:NAD-dependent epimerase/dehydratase family protein [bacterium]